MVANWPVIEKALSLSTEVGGIHFRALNNFLNKKGMSDWMPHRAYESQRYSIKLGPFLVDLTIDFYESGSSL